MKTSATYGVRRQSLEEIDGLLEVVCRFLLRSIVGVTSWIESANASTMLGPLMLPERLVVALIVLPVYIHVVERALLAILCKGGANARIGTGSIAVRVVGRVAVIWPKAMDRP